MDTTRIEKSAVNEVENLFIDNSLNIDINLATDDTGISFDGNITIYSDESITKKSYLGSIPIQVKGKLVHEFSFNTAKFYNFDKSTFENFLYEDGVVVFFVEILKSNPNKKKIFYTFLSVSKLETILQELGDKNKNSKVIELNEITNDFDLDREFREIAVYRKAFGFKDVKLQLFLNNNSEMLFSNDYEKEIVEKALKHVEKYEYMNSNSQYNKELKKSLEELLSKNIILDELNLVRVYGEIETKNLLKILPESNRKLAILIKARYMAMIQDYESARSVLSLVEDYQNNIQNVYDKVLIEAHYDSNDIETIIDNTILDDNEKSKYKANYFLKRNNLTRFYKILLESTDDDEWQYLQAKYLLSLQNYEEGIEILSKVLQRHSIVSIQYEILQMRFDYTTNNILFNFQEQIEVNDNELLKLLEDVIVIRQQVAKVEHVEMPNLEKLYFELKILLNTEDATYKLDDLLNSKDKEYDELYLIEWKIKILCLIGENEKVLNLIQELSEDKINHEVIRLKVLTLIKERRFEDTEKYIMELFNKSNFEASGHLLNFLLGFYLISVTNLKSVDVEIFNSTIGDLMQNYKLDLPLLFLIENTRKEINSDEYGSLFDSIIEKFLDYPDVRKFQTAHDFLYRNNELDFALKLYPSIVSESQKKADEILVGLYFMNDMNKEALDILKKYEDNELSKALAILKAKTFNVLEQFNATVQLYKNKNLTDPEYLKHILDAKIQINDSEDVNKIIEKLLKTEYVSYEVTAAISLIHFGIDLAHGFQLIGKHILNEKFLNTELNQILIQLTLFNNKSIENNRTINLYNNIDLKWYKFKNSDSIREIILVPEEWEIDNYDNYEFYKTSSDLKILVQGIQLGDSINFDGEEYLLIEEKSLIRFIFQRTLNKESGSSESNKLFKTFSIDPENGGINNLVNFMKDIDNSDSVREAESYYNKFRFPSIYGLVIPKDSAIEFYLNLFHDVNTEYYIGSEEEFRLSSNYVISISSMVYLASMNLLDILKEYPNIYVERTQQLWLKRKFSEVFENTTLGRLNIGEKDNLIINQNSKELKKELKEIYRKMTLVSGNLKPLDVGFIDEKLNELTKFDAASVQVAIDKKLSLFYEDEVIQLFSSEFNIQIGSVGSLISNYYLEKEKDVESLLNILIRVIENKSAWVIQKNTIEKIYTLANDSQDVEIMNKLNKWGKSYAKYFGLY